MASASGQADQQRVMSAPFTRGVLPFLKTLHFWDWHEPCSVRASISSVKGSPVKYAILTAVASLAMASAAQATTVFNFDADAAAGSQLNGTPSGFTVSSGSVDIVKSGDYGITCAGGSGGCLDLDGSTGHAGVILSSAAFVATAGLANTVTLDISGNQRGGANDTFIGALLFDPSTILQHITVTFGSQTLYSDVTAASGLASISIANLASGDLFRTLSVTFTTTTDSAYKLQLGALGGDDIGPIVDNLTVSAVPEPATWGLMLVGFGLMGAAVRRRNVRTSVTFA